MIFHTFSTCLLVLPSYKGSPLLDLQHIPHTPCHHQHFLLPFPLTLLRSNAAPVLPSYQGSPLLVSTRIPHVLCPLSCLSDPYSFTLQWPFADPALPSHKGWPLLDPFTTLSYSHPTPHITPGTHQHVLSPPPLFFSSIAALLTTVAVKYLLESQKEIKTCSPSRKQTKTANPTPTKQHQR